MPKHILIVDDSLDLIGAYRDVLEEQGYSVTTATGGDQALAHIRQQRPDLLITDIFMAGMDGLELIARVRREVPDPRLPIVAVSGMKAARDEALKRGADAFALKPLDYDVLVSLARDGLEAPLSPAQVTNADVHRRASRELAQVAVESYLTNEPQALEGMRRLMGVASRFFGQPRAMLLWASHGEIVLGGSSDPELEGKPVPEALKHVAQAVIESGSGLVASRGSSLMADLFKCELRFVVGVPLMLGGVPLGALVMADDQPHVFSAVELRLLEQVGARAVQVVGHQGPSVDPSGLALRDTFLSALSTIMEWSAERHQVLGIATARLAEPLPHDHGLSLMLDLPPRSLAGNLGMRAAFFTPGHSAAAVREQLSRFRATASQLGKVVQWSQLVLDQPLPPVTAAGLIEWCSQLAEPPPGLSPHAAVGLELAEVPLASSPGP